MNLAPPEIPILFCWRCSIVEGEFVYKIKHDGSIQMLPFAEHYWGPVRPMYEGQPGVFPATSVGLRPLSERETKLAAKLREENDHRPQYWYLTRPVHQVGGEPMIYNPASDIECMECKRAMPFFAVFCDNATGQGYQRIKDKAFSSNSGLQLVVRFCVGCSIIRACLSSD